jgi:UDP-N-acetylmuramoylalanine-D-glutamate ligase
LALPSNGELIARACAAAGPAGELEVRTVEATARPEGWLGGAVAEAFAWARPRAGVVLLSPAAASFDHFDDYRHRARIFSDAAARCVT